MLTSRLFFQSCNINGSLNLGGADVPSLYLRGTRVRGILADGLKTRGAVTLDRGFRSDGTVSLAGTRIGTNVSCREGRFDGSPKGAESRAGMALVLDGAEIGGYVFLNQGFHASGIVRLVGARLRGDLVCTGGVFEPSVSAAAST